MQYLFFDIEGANSYDFVSKMCTFGYVITDQQFDMKLKIDVIMNPETSFDRHIIRENMNAYPLERYENSPSFSYFYNAIKNILQTKKQIVAGWSVENDVRYIYDACKRYKLTQIQYRYIDIQKIYMQLFNLSTVPSLENACENLKIDLTKVHKSDEDAMLTMLVAKELCRKLDMSFDKLVERYKDCGSSVAEFSKKTFSDKEIEAKIQRRKVNYAIKNYVSQKRKHHRLIKFYYTFAFSQGVIENYALDVADVAKKLKDYGAKCTLNVKEATHIICLQSERNKFLQSRHDEDVKVYTLDRLKKSLAVN